MFPVTTMFIMVRSIAIHKPTITFIFLISIYPVDETTSNWKYIAFKTCKARICWYRSYTCNTHRHLQVNISDPQLIGNVNYIYYLIILWTQLYMYYQCFCTELTLFMPECLLDCIGRLYFMVLDGETVNFY